MKIIISPAKKLTNEKKIINNTSSIKFSNEAKYLVKQLRDYKLNDLRDLMSLSDNLAKTNHIRYQKWDLKSEEVNPAIYMFQGDVYKGLNAHNFSDEELVFAQDNLRILSGLYGLLKPLDLVFPYRLEMSTNIKTKEGDNLYDFWNNKLRISLTSEMKDDEILVNLASNEYSRALQLERFERTVIKPVFKDYKNGKLKVISFFAKKARGDMANFIIRNKIEDELEIRYFNNNGYKFAGQNNKEIIFTR